MIPNSDNAFPGTESELKAHMEQRARVVGTALLGTCDALLEHATQEETDNSDFCKELDEYVMLCDCCGWWSESHDVNDESICIECADEDT